MDQYIGQQIFPSEVLLKEIHNLQVENYVC